MGHIKENNQFGQFAFLLIWTLFLLPSMSGQEEPRLKLQDRLFVALKGENLSIAYKLTNPPNLTKDHLTCFDPDHKQISVITATTPEHSSFVLKNMMISGEYCCQFKTAKACWFLRVRDSGYKGGVSWNYTEVIIVFVFTGLLLVFSVGGSVYYFRGHWECCKVKKKTQNSDERQEEMGETANDPAQSTSFYASLEARPRSIYDVLDHAAAASGHTDQKPQTKAKTPKRKDGQNTVDKAPQNQDEGIFECVYENF